ncbi:hypothetical protein Ae406Ps2_6489 [Pseudonocardia sp. Ae406_Ps2]|nr:hypothetical protein Ae406Ps2_6489 [Pseudonocardia sp. Ae406_Ps2]
MSAGRGSRLRVLGHPGGGTGRVPLAVTAGVGEEATDDGRGVAGAGGDLAAPESFEAKLHGGGPTFPRSGFIVGARFSKQADDGAFGETDFYGDLASGPLPAAGVQRAHQSPFCSMATSRCRLSKACLTPRTSPPLRPEPASPPLRPEPASPPLRPDPFRPRAAWMARNALS